MRRKKLPSIDFAGEAKREHRAGYKWIWKQPYSCALSVRGADGKLAGVSGKTASPIRVAVLGTGSLGQHHARIYAEMAAAGAVEFAGVFDAVPETARAFAEKFQTRAFTSVAEAAATSDALNIVTPTTTHFAIARELLAGGKHVFIEKPMTSDLPQADELIRLAQQHGRLIQVGHIERFNPVFQFLQSMATAPRFLEAHRLSPHPGRGADVSVVLDLMIHDLDIVLALVDSPLVQVEATGVAVLSQSEDLVQARLRFANGCIANLTASRVHDDRQRTLRVFHGGSEAQCLTVDFRTQEAWTHRVSSEDDALGEGAAVVNKFAGRQIVRTPVAIQKEEPLKLELRHFVECVRTGKTPLVDGAAGRRALELALQIMGQIAAAKTGAAQA